MSKRWNRLETWLALFVIGVCLVLVLISGLWVYVRATSTPLHPKAEDVPSTTRSTPSPEWTEGVARGRQIARAGITEQNLPGLSVAVGVRGDIVWAEAFGWADLERRVPVVPETPFRVGSASKMFTSAGAGLLMEQGRLKLDDEIQTYVPEYPKKQWPVTLRQLMGHLAGVRSDDGDEEDLSEHCEDAAGGIRRFKDSPLLFEPGTRYRYSSYGWILVSAAIESAAAEPFAAFMRKEIFEPAGMHDTSTEATKVAPNRAVFYFPRFVENTRYGPQEPEVVDYSCFSGSSAILSTPSDAVRFVMAVNGGTLLKPATVQLLQTSQRLPSGQETGYGLGWDLETVSLLGEQTPVIGYDGALKGGTVVSFMAFPERGIAVAVMSNMAHADTASLALSLAQTFAGAKADAHDIRR